MAQSSPPRRRALIVEDEFMIALDLENAMLELGFDVCGLAPSDTRARSLGMDKEPDVALVDVCLEGGREGIETARWLQEVCGTSVVFVTAYNDKDTTTRIHDREPGAPVLSKLTYRDGLSAAVAEVTTAARTAPFAR
jgi:AmiR/NasT family two-component response regulator